MDRFSRDIVGWRVTATMTESLVLAALRQAIRGAAAEGGPGASHRPRRPVRRARTTAPCCVAPAMRQSMSRADNCYDNAFMESCCGTFKTETGNDRV